MPSFFVDFDEASGLWCIFHTHRRQGHAYASYADKSDAMAEAARRNS